MISYEHAKFLHVALAVLAGGISAGAGLWLERARRAPEREDDIRRDVVWVQTRAVLPLALALGASGLLALWVGGLPWDLPWIAASTALYALLVALLVADLVLLRRRASVASIVVGGAAGVVFLVLVYLMVVRPRF